MGGRIGGPKVRNSNQWTEARFRSFIRSNIRRASMKWGPIIDILKEARVERGIYLCNGCKQEVPATTKVDGKRVKNVHVDHIIPITDPTVGFTTWDDLIDRMFCEKENLQVLCNECHTIKTNEEKAIAKRRRAGDEDFSDET